MNLKGQVWIETVVYILIGLALIAIVLAFVMPRINEEKNKAIVEQTIKALSVLDDKINEVVPIIKKSMEDVYHLRLPLVVDVSLGKNWGNMKSFNFHAH